MTDGLITKKNDKTTLRNLIKEAKKYLKDANKEFEKSDCSEAMHEAETWDAVVEWLKGKLAQ